MKNLIYILLLSCSFSAFSQQKYTNSQAINIVSKQAMLSQRMAKDKIYKVNNINRSVVTAELNSSLILFEKNIETLQNKIELPPVLNKKVNTLDLLWVG